MMALRLREATPAGLPPDEGLLDRSKGFSSGRLVAAEPDGMLTHLFWYRGGTWLLSEEPSWLELSFRIRLPPRWTQSRLSLWDAADVSANGDDKGAKSDLEDWPLVGPCFCVVLQAASRCC